LTQLACGDRFAAGMIGLEMRFVGICQEGDAR
jgi:hypothetical protein